MTKSIWAPSGSCSVWSRADSYAEVLSAEARREVLLAVGTMLAFAALIVLRSAWLVSFCIVGPLT